jgi:hypothetical protein
MYAIKIFKTSSVCKNDYIIWGVPNYVQFSSKFLQLRINFFNYFYTEASVYDTILPKHVELCETFKVNTFI